MFHYSDPDQPFPFRLCEINTKVKTFLARLNLFLTYILHYITLDYITLH